LVGECNINDAKSIGFNAAGVMKSGSVFRNPC
jgi:hypothetical protein